MSTPFHCPNGHRWHANAAGGALAILDHVLCPECGSPADSQIGNGATGNFIETPVESTWNEVQPNPIHIAGYEILGELGRGGMGVVYKARHHQLKRIVALKVIRVDAHVDDEHISRFRTEAEAAARLQHPNIVQIYEVGEWTPPNGVPRPYMALEFVDGVNLDRKLRETKLTPREAAELIAVIGNAIAFAHERQVIHRDLKPANVLIAADGTAKIADFGLAKQLDADSGQTQTGAILGTPSYMAPEQARGDVAQIGPRTDVYALGAILYEAITGRPPFRGATAIETFEQIQRLDPVPPSRITPGLSRDLETICLKCLHKDPKDRYRSAAALADDLQRFLDGEAIRARPLGRGERAWRWAKRRRRMIAAAGAVAVLVVAMSIAGAWILRRPALPRPEPETVIVTPPSVEKYPGHSMPVFATAFSKDGAQVITGAGPAYVDGPIAPDADATARIWDLQTGNQVARFRAVKGPILQVSWSPNPGRILTGEMSIEDRAGVVREWEIATGRESRQFLVDQSLFTPWTRFVFSADGALVASSSGGRALIYDVRAGKRVGEFACGQNGPFCLSFSPDGTRLAAIADTGEVYVWQTANAKSVQRFPASFKDCAAITYFPDGKRILFATDNKVYQLNPETKGPPSLLVDAEDTVGVLAVSNNSQFAATGAAMSGAVRLWDLRTKKLVHKFDDHSISVLNVAFSPDDRSVLTSSIDSTWRIWDVESGRELKRFGESRSLIKPTEVGEKGPSQETDWRGPRSPSSGEEASGERPERPRELSPEERSRFTEHADFVYAGAFTHMGQAVTVGGGIIKSRFLPGTDRSVRIWDPLTGKQISSRSPGHEHAITAMAIAPNLWKKSEADKSWIATGSWDGKILFSDLAGTQEQKPIPMRAGIRSLAFSQGAGYLVVGGEDKCVHLVKVRERNLTWSKPHDAAINCVAVSPNDQLIAAACANGRVYVYSFLKGTKLHDFKSPHHGAVLGVAFSPESDRILATCDNGSIIVWRIETEEKLVECTGHMSAVWAAAFSPNGRAIVSGGDDGTVRLWDARSGENAYQINRGAHAAPVTSVSFSPKGNMILSTSMDRTAFIWMIPGLQ